MTPVIISLFAATGLLLVILGLPLLRRRIKPNGWYGLRVAATFADEQVWYDANAAAGRDFILLGILQVAIALVPPLFGANELVYVVANVTVIAIGTMWIAIAGIRRANNMLRDRRQHG